MSDKQQQRMVLAYRKIRDAISETNEKLDELKKQQKIIADELLDYCNETGFDGFKTPDGTVSRTTVTTYWTSDWDAMLDVVHEHDAPQLLVKRLNSRAVGEFFEEHPELTPPGLQSKTEYRISVRKPTSRG